MDLLPFRMLIHEFLNKGPDIVPWEAPLIFLDSKFDICMDKNGKYTNHTRHTEDLLSNIIRGASYETISGSLFKNS